MSVVRHVVSAVLDMSYILDMFYGHSCGPYNTNNNTLYDLSAVRHVPYRTCHISHNTRVLDWTKYLKHVFASNMGCTNKSSTMILS